MGHLHPDPGPLPDMSPHLLFYHPRSPRAPRPAHPHRCPQLHAPPRAPPPPARAPGSHPRGTAGARGGAVARAGRPAGLRPSQRGPRCGPAGTMRRLRRLAHLVLFCPFSKGLQVGKRPAPRIPHPAPPPPRALRDAADRPYPTSTPPRARRTIPRPGRTPLHAVMGTPRPPHPAARDAPTPVTLDNPRPARAALGRGMAGLARPVPSCGVPRLSRIGGAEPPSPHTDWRWICSAPHAGGDAG